MKRYLPLQCYTCMEVHAKKAKESKSAVSCTCWQNKHNFALQKVAKWVIRCLWQQMLFDACETLDFFYLFSLYLSVLCMLCYVWGDHQTNVCTVKVKPRHKIPLTVTVIHLIWAFLFCLTTFCLTNVFC